MKKQDAENTPSTQPLLIEIIDVLEAYGIDHDTYALQDYIDVDALEQLVTSEDADLEIRLTIEGIQLRITRYDVHAINQSSNVDNLPSQK